MHEHLVSDLEGLRLEGDGAPQHDRAAAVRQHRQHLATRRPAQLRGAAAGVLAEGKVLPRQQHRVVRHPMTVQNGRPPLGASALIRRQASLDDHRLRACPVGCRLTQDSAAAGNMQ